MSHPDLVASHLGDEEPVATVNLSGEDALVITPTRSLLYRSEGLLSDESVSEFPHDVEGLAVDPGRRKTTVVLEYAIEDDRRLRVANARLDTLLHYLLAGIFHAKGITAPGETVQAVYRFNELTVVVTSERVVSHVGSVVWDEEYDEYRYADLTGLDFEEGNIATEIVLYVDGRSQRIKVPKESAEKVRQGLEEAVFAYWDVESMLAFEEAVGREEPVSTDPEDPGIMFDEAVAPLTTESDEEDDPAEAEMPSYDIAAIEDAIAELTTSVEEQRHLLEAQEEALAALQRALED